MTIHPPPSGEYKIAKGWAIFIYVFMPALIALFIWLFIQSFTNPEFKGGIGWFFMAVSPPMIIGMAIGIKDTYVRRIIINNDSITSIGAFSQRELQFHEIKGFMVEDKFTSIEAKDENKKRIRVTKYLGGYNEILQWLAENFTDLEVQTKIDDEKDIVTNESFGLTQELRIQRLEQAKKVSKIINLAGGVTAVWAIFYPKLYEYCILACIIIPAVIIVIVKIFNGLIKIEERKGSGYPSVFSALIFVSFALMIRALADFEIYDYSNAWMPVGITTVVLSVAVFARLNVVDLKNKSGYFTALFIVVVLAAYSYGAVISINCVYDNSLPQNFTAEVLDKRISSGKSKSYYFKVTAWGKQPAGEVEVDRDLYEQTSTGDNVSVDLMNGRFGIPWVSVSAFTDRPVKSINESEDISILTNVDSTELLFAFKDTTMLDGDFTRLEIKSIRLNDVIDWDFPVIQSNELRFSMDDVYLGMTVTDLIKLKGEPKESTSPTGKTTYSYIEDLPEKFSNIKYFFECEAVDGKVSLMRKGYIANQEK